MRKDVYTLDANDSMWDASRIMKEKNIQLIPVTLAGQLVGVVTDRDLKRAAPSEATTLAIYEVLYLLTKVKLKEIMTKNPITVTEDLTIAEVAQILIDNKISGVPVVNKKGQVKGIIDKEVIFKVMVSLTGLKQRGVEFGIILKDKSGSIKEAADIIRAYGGRIASILTSYQDVTHGYRKVYFRMYNVDREYMSDIKKKISTIGYLLYIIDHNHNNREIYDYLIEDNEGKR